jgi:hypothetical protein
MRPRQLLTVASACVALLLAAAGAGAMTHHPALSKAEFRQLQLAQKRIKSLESSDARNLNAANRVCKRMRDVSRLIAAVRRGCLDLVRLGGDDAKLNARATRCGIDPASEAAILSCLLPAMQGYHADAETFYRAESRVNRLAKARGFSNVCVAVIGDSPSNVAAEGRLAGDLEMAVQALKSQNPEALQNLSSQIEATVKAIRPGPSSLLLCPHR